MIVLFSDYGNEGPYTGQVEAAILSANPGASIVNLTACAPRNNPKASAYLLASYAVDFPSGSIFFCVVDPGVGGFQDVPVIVKADERTFVGPDNGLFDIVIARSNNVSVEEITWQPKQLSNSFHGRDIYAPVCSMLSLGERPESQRMDWINSRNFPEDLDQVIFIDHFGNCMSGLRARNIQHSRKLLCNGSPISHARTFSEVEEGQVFWYENANGLVEIAVNCGDASQVLGLEIGSHFQLI